jgi:epoxide hydrolase-like predicted phosphatase
MSTPINTVIFDIGNVLVHLRFDRVYSRIREKTALELHQIAERMANDPNYYEHESGRMTSEEFFRLQAQALEYSGTMEELIACWRDHFLEPMHSTLEVARALKQRGLQLAIISNINPVHEEVMENFEFIGLFPVRVYSHLVGVMKPNPAIYHHAAARLKLVPESTVFIDDKPENIAAARALGWQGIVMRPHHTDLAAELRALGLDFL